MSDRFMILTGTPIVAVKRPDLKIRQFAIGRMDTKEMWCIGSFGKQFADMYDKDEVLYFTITKDGKISEHYSKEKEMMEVVMMNEDRAVVGIKFDNYWLVPNGFKEWAEKIFNYKAEKV